MGFSLWFEEKTKKVKIGISLIIIFIATFIGWYIGQLLFFVGLTLQQTLSFIAFSCTGLLIVIIYLVIRYKSG